MLTCLTAAASGVAAPRAAAQTQSYAQARAYDFKYNREASAFDIAAPYTYVGVPSASAWVTGVEAMAGVDHKAGKLVAKSATSENRLTWLNGTQQASAAVGFLYREDISAKCPVGGCPDEYLELYFHAALSGSASRLPGHLASAAAVLNYSVFAIDIRGRRNRIEYGVAASDVLYSSGNSNASETRNKTLVRLPVVTGVNSYEVFVNLLTSATNGFTADASHTVDLFRDRSAAHTYAVYGGALSRQSRPAWAVQSVVPEPRSLLLLGAGVLLLAGTAARRAAVR